jgi:hypothetical protein
VIYSKPNLAPPADPSNPSAATPGQIIIQVKGGKPGVKDVRDVRGVLDREKAAMAVLIPWRPHVQDGGRSRERWLLRAQDHSGPQVTQPQ